MNDYFRAQAPQVSTLGPQAPQVFGTCRVLARLGQILAFNSLTAISVTSCSRRLHEENRERLLMPRSLSHYFIGVRMKIYITFGPDNVHHVKGAVFDSDCLCEIECETPEEGRAIAMREFCGMFCTSYEKYELGLYDLKKLFPRGIIKLEYKGC